MQAICEGNKGILATVNDRAEIDTIQKELGVRGIAYPRK